jgi:hypothetical protein
MYDIITVQLSHISFQLNLEVPAYDFSEGDTKLVIG